MTYAREATISPDRGESAGGLQSIMIPQPKSEDGTDESSIDSMESIESVILTPSITN